jgi:hypothetical protein
MRAMRPPQNRLGRADAINHNIEKTADDQPEKKKDNKHHAFIFLGFIFNQNSQFIDRPIFIFSIIPVSACCFSSIPNIPQIPKRRKRKKEELDVHSFFLLNLIKIKGA